MLYEVITIYFDLAAKKRVVQNLFDRLHPEGYLLLGHSESLMNISTAFVLRHFLNLKLRIKELASEKLRE